MKLRRFILFCIVTITLAGCRAAAPASVPAAPAQEPAAPVPSVTAAQAPAENPTATTEPTPAPIQRGPGDFDLSDTAKFLGDLPRYRAVLKMVFDGQKDGQPYHVETVYDALRDRGEGANLLKETGKRADGSTYEIFSGTYQYGQYMKASPDQPCRFGKANPITDPFSPVRLLPKPLGAEPAGQETLDGVAANVYSFDERAVGASGAGMAAGKVWVAVDGGWVVKYELSLKSDQAFGAGITGEQRWEYAISDQKPGPLGLPDDCPLPLTNAPVHGSAYDFINLPNEIRYVSDATAQALGEFYTQELKSQGFAQQGDPVETSGGTRWLFGKREGEQAVLYVLTVKPAEGKQSVRLTRVVAEAPPAQE